MTRNIGGTLDATALRRLHFTTLTRSEQAAAIRRLSATAQPYTTIATATGLSVEMIRRILAEEAV
jgi:hypothetical protein